MLVYHLFSMVMLTSVVLCTKLEDHIMRVCGGKLSDLIRDICGESNYYPAFPINTRRYRRGVADDCCTNGCSIKTIAMYCASPPAPTFGKYKRTTDESDDNPVLSSGIVNRLGSVNQNSLTDYSDRKTQYGKFSHSKEVKRQITAEPEVSTMIKGQTGDKESPKFVFDESKYNEDGDKVVEEELKREIANASVLPPREVLTKSSIKVSPSKASTNSISSQREAQEDSNSQLINRILSSTNNSSSTSSKRPPTPRLQIGVQKPYFIGRSFVIPKTRYLLNQDASWNVQKNK